jgi:hypothetical protein
MRTSIIFALAMLVPTAAFADDEEKSPEDTGGYTIPHAVPYQGGRIPATASLESRPSVPLIATGAGILGAAYLGSLIYGLATCTAQQECRSGSGWLYVPIVGPFVAAAQAPTTGGQALALFDGGVQVAGAALIAAGFIFQKKFVVWQTKGADVRVLPTAGPNGGGLSVILTQ